MFGSIKREFINAVGLSRSSADLLIRKIMDLYIFSELMLHLLLKFWLAELLNV